MKKIIGNVIIIIYAIIAVFITVCLLSYNDYKITEFGDSSFVIISDDEVKTESSEFNKGDLVIVNRKDKVEVGEDIFFYNTYSNEMEVSLGKIINQEKISVSETTYTLEGDVQLSSQYVVGSAETATTIGVIGGILEVLESKWGFLFIIVFPSLLAFIYELGVVISEIIGKRKETEKKEK